LGLFLGRDGADHHGQGLDGQSAQLVAIERRPNRRARDPTAHGEKRGARRQPERGTPPAPLRAGPGLPLGRQLRRQADEGLDRPDGRERSLFPRDQGLGADLPRSQLLLQDLGGDRAVEFLPQLEDPALARPRLDRLRPHPDASALAPDRPALVGCPPWPARPATPCSAPTTAVPSPASSGSRPFPPCSRRWRTPCARSASSAASKVRVAPTAACTPAARWWPSARPPRSIPPPCPSDSRSGFPPSWSSSPRARCPTPSIRAFPVATST